MSTDGTKWQATKSIEFIFIIIFLSLSLFLTLHLNESKKRQFNNLFICLFVTLFACLFTFFFFTMKQIFPFDLCPFGHPV